CAFADRQPSQEQQSRVWRTAAGGSLVPVSRSQSSGRFGRGGASQSRPSAGCDRHSQQRRQLFPLEHGHAVPRLYRGSVEPPTAQIFEANALKRRRVAPAIRPEAALSRATTIRKRTLNAANER